MPPLDHGSWKLSADTYSQESSSKPSAGYERPVFRVAMAIAITGGCCEGVCFQTGGIPQVSPGPSSPKPMVGVMSQRWLLTWIKQTLLCIFQCPAMRVGKGHLDFVMASRTASARSSSTAPFYGLAAPAFAERRFAWLTKEMV